MIVSIHQPAYLPWLGYFERIAASDRHVVLDTVQLEKNSFTNRNRVRTPQGPCWLTVPVKSKGRFGALRIDEVELVDDRWQKKHWGTLHAAYRHAPYFAQHAPFFEALYRKAFTMLAPLLRETTGYLLEAFGISTPIVQASALDPQGSKDELVLDLCRRVGATTYLSGALGRQYLREELFRDAGITVRYQDYRHPIYPQQGDEFVPYLSAVDLLFNCGPKSLAILRGEPR